MLWQGILADVIVVLHFAYMAFLVFGLLLILLGMAFRWDWIRNPWFRLIHLAMILIVVFESAIGMTCPLTTWEKQLREIAGQATYPGDFIGYWAHRLLFYSAEPWVFGLIYTVFGLAVVAAFLLAPPRFRSGERINSPTDPGAAS
jgi:hypothetical protein